MTNKFEKTDKKIRQAFITLYGQEAAGGMNVNKICSIADIHRNTFYLHYESMEHLRSSMVRGYPWISQNISYADAVTRALYIKNSAADSEKIKIDTMCQLLQIHQEKKEVFLSLFAPEKTENWSFYVSSIQKDLRKALKNKGWMRETDTLDTVSYMYATAIANTTRQWLLDESKTARELSCIFVRTLNI